MRVIVIAVAAFACGPKQAPSRVGEDFSAESQSSSADPQPVVTRVEAPPGKGMRKGTIARPKLAAVLRQGPGTFLRQFEVSPQLDGRRFVGWRLVQLLDRSSPLADVDLAPGDVLLAINGNSLSRPDQLQTLWDSLGKANALDAVLLRGSAKFQLAFTIEPAAAR